MQSSKSKTAGFTLLETLLAAVVLALMAIPTMSAFSQAAEQSRPRIERLEKFEFAVSLLEEHIAIGDFGRSSGKYENRFFFEVVTMPYPDVEPTRFDDLIAFTEIKITVWDSSDDANPAEIVQIVARSAQ